tara:strand:+ start:716 stop:1207 length:492 start_codon:yes stop_codon:yes gene_type:complete
MGFLNSNVSLIVLCREHGTYYASINEMLGFHYRDVLSCPKCPKKELSKNFKWDENPRLDQKIEMICSEHGKFITTPNKIIGNENLFYNCECCPKCPEYLIASNNFSSRTKRQLSITVGNSNWFVWGTKPPDNYGYTMDNYSDEDFGIGCFVIIVIGIAIFILF